MSVVMLLAQLEQLSFADFMPVLCCPAPLLRNQRVSPVGGVNALIVGKYITGLYIRGGNNVAFWCTQCTKCDSAPIKAL
jgi:hypothetical protein